MSYNSSILYTFKIKNSILIFRILSERFSEDIIYSIIPYINKALQNVLELFHYHFNAPIDNSQFHVMLIIKELHDCNGKYSNNTIFIDNGLLESKLKGFESVIFHELVHYFYDRLFPDKIKDLLLSLTEGIAYYFECLFYDDKELSYFLLRNIQGEDRNLHYACALAKHLYENNMIKMLMNNDKYIFNLQNYVIEFSSYEASTLNKLIEKEIDFIVIDHDDGVERAFGFFYRKGFDAPLVTSYNTVSVLWDYNIGRIKHLFISDEAIDLPGNCLLSPVHENLYEYISLLYGKIILRYNYFDSIINKTSYKPLWYM